MSHYVVYVEDSPDDVFFMKRAFKKVAPEVQLLIIQDGRQASEFFLASENEDILRSLSLVILDFNLPGHSGLEILSHIREKSVCSKVPVIMFSASHQKKDIDSCHAAGCNSYLVKPNNQGVLKTSVLAINDSWLKP